MFDSDSAFVAPSRPYDPDFEPGRSSVGSYVRAIRKHPLLIAAVVLAALVASLLYTAVRSSQYHATAQILVTPVPTASTYPTGLSVLRDSADPTMTIETAAALVRSQEAAALAASRLGHGWTANKLLSAVSVAPQGGTDVLDVTATAGSSAAATRIANTFAAASVDAQTTALHSQIDAAIASLSAQRAALGTHGGSTAAGLSSTISALEAERGLPNPSLSLSQPATAATAAGSSAGLVIGLALLCGLLVGLAAAVLVEAASNSVRDEEEFASLYPAPVLARVRSLGAGTTGSTDLRGAPTDSGNGNPPWLMPAPVAEAFRSLLFQIRLKGADSQVVMVTSASAGEGKTASAVNLAAAAAAAGRSVLLLDLDLRRSG
ncbi:MAG: Wzz/FepE/Etk N-terminal domain-containing protein, partial [Solirubrobacteraceae bacterium]